MSLVGDAVHPDARMAVERRIAGPRFVVTDAEVFRAAVIGGAFALTRSILDERRGLRLEAVCARRILA